MNEIKNDDFPLLKGVVASKISLNSSHFHK